MLIHQGWFTSLYSQDFLALQRFEFLICILLEHQMPLIRCTNLFYQGGYPVTLFPTPRRLAQSLGLENTWARQLQSGSCHYPTHGRIQRWGGDMRSGPQPPLGIARLLIFAMLKFSVRPLLGIWTSPPPTTPPPPPPRENSYHRCHQM